MKLYKPYDPFREWIKFLKKQNTYLEPTFKVPNPFKLKLQKVKPIPKVKPFKFALPKPWKPFQFPKKRVTKDPFKALLKKYRDSSLASIKKQMQDYLNPKPLKKKKKVDPVTKYLASYFGDTYDDNSNYPY